MWSERIISESSMQNARSLHRVRPVDSSPTAPAAPSESDLGLNEKLDGFDVRVVVKRKSEIDVQHVSKGRARAEYAQAEADVAEPAGMVGIGVGPSSRAAEIVEHGAPHAEQSQRIPVGIHAALDVQERTVITALVVPRITSQARVSPQHELASRGGIPENVA